MTFVRKGSIQRFNTPVASRRSVAGIANSLIALVPPPPLYERFSHKSELLTLLRRRARVNLFSAIRTSRSPMDACRRALDFFTAHPNDYRLISEDWAMAFARKEDMPSFEFIKA